MMSIANIKFYFNKIRHSIRRFILTFNRKNVVIDRSSYWGPSVDIEVSKTGSLTIANGVMISKGSFIGVRENGKLTIGHGTFINRNTMIVSHKSINIGSKVTIGPNCCFFDHDHKICNQGEYVLGGIVIDDNVWIGASVVILKGVHIGANSVIAAGSIVSKDVPPNTIFIQKKQEEFRRILNS